MNPLKGKLNFWSLVPDLYVVLQKGPQYQEVEILFSYF